MPRELQPLWSCQTKNYHFINTDALKILVKIFVFTKDQKETYFRQENLILRELQKH